ncbi:MAG: hypothetical protein KDJ75_02975 [Alphaproteobacteria bacterium]|nr:hypothetical protein [Alphaproteobacteria bacterium]
MESQRREDAKLTVVEAAIERIAKDVVDSVFKFISGFISFYLRRSSLRESVENEAIQSHEDKFWIAAPPLAARNDMTFCCLPQGCLLNFNNRLIKNRIVRIINDRFAP